MKFATIGTVALAAMIKAVHADFDLFAQGVGGNGVIGNAWGWQAYDGVPKCGHTSDWIWASSKDVSGGKYGVRCKGTDSACVSSGDPKKIKVLEMNFNSKALHFTLYADRDWGLYDLSNKKVGSCSPVAKHDVFDYDCGTSVGRVAGQKFFHCTTSAATADKIHDSRPK